MYRELEDGCKIMHSVVQLIAIVVQSCTILGEFMQHLGNSGTTTVKHGKPKRRHGQPIHPKMRACIGAKTSSGHQQSSVQRYERLQTTSCSGVETAAVKTLQPSRNEEARPCVYWEMA
jgi:hypothetical protein